MNIFYKVVFSISILFLNGSSCENRIFLPGDLGKVSEAILVKCSPFEDQDHSCLVLNNPIKQQLRVFDITENQYLLAPIGYFPLAIKTGDYTARLASHSELPFVFALDSPSGDIFVTSLKYASHKQSFATPWRIATEKNAQAIEMFQDSSKVFWAAVALPENKLKLIPIDPSSGTKLASIDSKKIDLPFSPDHIKASPDARYLVITKGNENTVAIIDANDLTKEIVTVDTQRKNSRIVTGGFDFGSGPEPLAVVLGQDSPTASLITLNDAKQIATVDFASNAIRAYFPNNKSEVCCKNIKRWFAVATQRGKLMYIHLDKLKKDDLSQVLEKTQVELKGAKSIGKDAALPSAIVGGEVLIKNSSIDNETEKITLARKMFFTFETGVIARTDEGSSTIKLLGSS